MSGLCGEVDGRCQNMGDIHGIGQQPPGNDASASDDDHGRELTGKLRQQVIDETVDLFPGDDLASLPGRPGFHRQRSPQARAAASGAGAAT